ncbi:hypothetical protein [Methylotenera oryzisoli]|nr:hypothetical protein [Methylotenera oryzisoli]
MFQRLTSLSYRYDRLVLIQDDRANDGMYGNILLGGGVGAMLDHHNGNAYSYPDWIRVIMGDNLVFDRKNNEKGQLMLGSPSASVVPNDKKTLVENVLNYLP